MSIISKGYISQAVLIVGHDLDKRIRYKQEQAEGIFGPLFGMQSQQTNLPDDFDPAAPRLIFQHGKKQLIVSQVASQLTLGFESGLGKGWKEQVEIFIKNVNELGRLLCKFHDKLNGEVGVVFSLSIPSDASKNELTKKIFDSYISFKELGEIASSSFKVGFKTEDDFYLNFEADVYEMRGGAVSNFSGVIDIRSLPVHEVGFLFKIDLNNRPRQSVVTDFEAEIRTVAERAKDFMLNEMLDLPVVHEGL